MRLINGAWTELQKTEPSSRRRARSTTSTGRGRDGPSADLATAAKLLRSSGFRAVSPVPLRYGRVPGLMVTVQPGADLGAFRRVPRDVILRVRASGKHVEDTALRVLSDMTKLQELEVSDAEITDDGLRALVALDHLVGLSLWGCGVTDRGVAILTTLVGLRALNLGKTLVSDGVMAHLVRFPELRELNLRRTGISTDALSQLGSSPNLALLAPPRFLRPHERHRLERSLPAVTIT
jgi:hypothetical protein